jgi:outer membrane lipoprotein-sorting protein
MFHVFMFHVAMFQFCLAAPTTNPALWSRLVEIDSRAQKLTDLTADFEQQKFTTLLKKPLVSRGRVRMAGSIMRWDTADPEPSVMLIDDKEVRLYYPMQKAMEIYAIDQQLGSLAASPLPKLSVLREHFSFEAIGEIDAPKLSLRLTPTDKALREHVDEVRVLLDAAAGFIVRGEIDDADGDKTVMTFSNIRANAKLKEADLHLDVPADAKITHPLAALEK